MNKIRNSLGVLILLSTFYFLFSISFAEELDPASVASRRVQLESELQELEAQIDSYREVIQEKQRESTSLERDIAILDAKIEKARLGIRARNIRISNLNHGIQERSEYIDFLLEKTDKQKISLAELIRRANELDSTPLVEIVLGYDNLSDFFVDIDSFESIHKSIQISFEEIKESKIITEKERDELEVKKSEEIHLRAMQELEKKRAEEAEAEKKSILRITKGEEDRYQAIVKERQKDAARIRAELFTLRGTAAIPFEKAVEYANQAWKATGVRPAFLLGVIAEESNLGENVGTGNWKVDLSHSRCAKQGDAFVKITGELGLDPDLMPVSKRAWYGYCGGAMGPAQFMPTTWLLYKNAISRQTGHNPPNPWDPEDAFMAAALLLRDNGAVEGGYTAERRAALRYLAGGNWSKPAYAFYGDDVMELAAKYQEQINILQGL